MTLYVMSHGFAESIPQDLPRREPPALNHMELKGRQRSANYGKQIEKKINRDSKASYRAGQPASTDSFSTMLEKVLLVEFRRVWLSNLQHFF